MRMCERRRDTCVFESSSFGPRDLQLREMELSSKSAGQIGRVKSEPLDVGLLPEQGQQQQCNESAPGDKSYRVTLGMCHIKKEPPDDCSYEHQIIQVKTEPYNTAILEERDHMGHSHGSTPEGAKESSGVLHVKDQPSGTCDQASSGCTSSNVQIEIVTTTVEPRFGNTALITTLGRSAEQPSDQSETQEASKSSMFSHVKDSLVKCSCTAECSCSGSLARHKQGHTGKKPYTCDLCPAEFSHRRSLLYHKRAHTGEKPHKCNLCPAEFMDGAKLRLHRQTHTGEKPYKCDVCPAEFRQSKSLRSHKWAHEGKKPYKCDLCPAQFSHGTSLLYHKQKHTGKKPYKCDLCPAEFSHPTALKYHTRKHAGEKPFKCDLCPAMFTQNTSLRFHKLTHVSEGPYKCDLCTAKFTCKNILSRHKRIHTSEKPYKDIPVPQT
ncbi:zinc finger protein 383-like isoform X4 [Ornithodoros turicata]|uniref:zinc finger protein 383-like isoform X4 n=1 Tax=Ornithodoros turicata TaxID=34597 RepID=UPI00313954D2